MNEHNRRDRDVVSTSRSCIDPKTRDAAVRVVQLHAAAHVLTQLFFKTQKKSKNTATVTLRVSRAFFRAVVSTGRGCIDRETRGAAVLVVQLHAAAPL